MTAQKLILSLTTLTGGAIGLLAPIGFVKCLLRTDPERGRHPHPASSFRWCLGLLIGRKAGRRVTGGKRGRAEMKKTIVRE